MVEPLFSLPADLVTTRRLDGEIEVRRMAPHRPTGGILSSAPTACLAVLPEKERAKPVTGLWLTAKGWGLYLRGESIEGSKHLVASAKLWALEARVGVGLDPLRRIAEEGKLFTVQAVAFRRKEHGDPEGVAAFDVGFLAAVTGAELPAQLTLRLGGDGRGAVAERAQAIVPEPDYEAIAQARRGRLILTAPGIFANGWRPTGASGEGRDLRFDLHGVSARLVCAAVPRTEIVSGFDLAGWQPKPAHRIAAAGSVYWLEELNASPDSLRKLAERGLWSDPPENSQRCAEGFNRCTFATY
jgi:CRISPR-associated protein Cmr3